MSGIIYLIGENNELIELKEQPYDSEDVLQELLAKYPNLLAGDQVDAAEPRRWLLMSREIGLPAQEDAGSRWSVDHLFLDQDAVPTLVEVKRIKDTRIRREVVGQMLDYAANAVVYWLIETIKAQFELQCERENQESETVLTEFLGGDVNIESYWQQAKTNLQAGKVRLVFIADEIPPELRRIVEFLGKQMDPAEAIAVEVKLYAGKDVKTLVPRIVGGTVEKQITGQGRQWDEASFFADVEKRCGTEEAKIARNILEWARNRGLRIWWGRGKQDGSLYPIIDQNGISHWSIAV